MSKEEWDHLMEECDLNKDGKISRIEFATMMLNPEIALKMVSDYEGKNALLASSIKKNESDLKIKQKAS